MAEIDYQKLSRQQKLALFLIAIGPEAAAEVLKQFSDSETEALCREMSAFPMVTEALQKQVLEELAGILTQSSMSALGGLAYARRALEIAKGGPKASSIIGRVGPVGDQADVIKDISEMEGRQIYNMIKAEQPQTISFVLSYLDSAKASEVFALLNPDLRESVMERLGTIESTAPDLVAKIVRSLEKHFDSAVRPALHRRGGVQAVAGLLNKLDKEMTKSLLTKIEERNASLGMAIRRKMFSFEDLIRLQASDLQRILREVDTANLAIAMKSATEPLREKIYGSLSKRAAVGLREEIQLLGPVRLKDVEAAQDAIIQSVQRLEEAGEISIDAGGAQALVA
ncbi:MAG TPA: flagellar motor switch protein FliG [Opitutaceae bacterium]|nr:flagellar motor switch protein FliG [Opitutaceae bacterium]